MLAEVLDGRWRSTTPPGSRWRARPADDGGRSAVADVGGVRPLACEAAVRYVAAALAGTEHVATVVLRGARPWPRAERRTLERGALVTALVLLFARTVAADRGTLGGELLTDLLAGTPRPAAARARPPPARRARPPLVGRGGRPGRRPTGRPRRGPRPGSRPPSRGGG